LPMFVDVFALLLLKTHTKVGDLGAWMK